MDKFSSIIGNESDQLDVAAELDSCVKLALSEAASGRGGGGGFWRPAGNGPRQFNAMNNAANSQELARLTGRDSNKFEAIRNGFYHPSHNPSVPYTLMFGNKFLREFLTRKAMGHGEMASIVGLFPANIEDLYNMVVSYNTTGNPFQAGRQFYICANYEDTSAFSRSSYAGTKAANTILDPTAVKSAGDVSKARRADDGASTELAKKQFYAAMYWLKLVADMDTTNPNPSTAAYLENPTVLSNFIKEEKRAFSNYYKTLANGEIAQVLAEMDMARNFDGTCTNTPLNDPNQNDNGGENEGGQPEGAPEGGAEGSELGGVGGVPGSGLGESRVGKFDSMLAQLNEEMSFMGFRFGKRNHGAGWAADQLGTTGAADKAQSAEQNSALNDEEERAKVEAMDGITRAIYEIGGLYDALLDNNPEEWYKQHANEFIAGTGYMFVGGITQFMANRPITLMNWFTTEEDKNLWYGINHYPPPATGWFRDNRPIVGFGANMLRMTDKQLPWWRRLSYGFNGFFGGGVGRKVKGGVVG